MKTYSRRFSRTCSGKASRPVLTSRASFPSLVSIASRASLTRVALVALVALTPGQAVQAQSAKPALPEGNVNFIIPVSPGGGTDLTFRALSEAARKHLGRTIVVMNLPGAGGAIGLA